MKFLRHVPLNRSRTSTDSQSLSKFRLRKLLHNGFLHNVLALYGVQACTYALPLLTFPYLAHVLGPSGWGVVVFAQAIGIVIASVVEYGFDISASRETSLHRNDPKRLSELISGVLGAKSLLAVLCVAGALFSRRFTHNVAPSLALFWSSTIWGVCQGINMLWFFQGLERMRLASALEIAGKVLATLSIFVLVHKPEDGWKVMAAQCVGCVVSHGITVVLAYREVGFQWPTSSSMWNSLRLGGSMFLFRAVQGLSGLSTGWCWARSLRWRFLASTPARNELPESSNRVCGPSTRRFTLNCPTRRRTIPGMPSRR